MTIGTAGSICKCGLAKSYHGRGPNFPSMAEYRPRYPDGSEPTDRDPYDEWMDALRFCSPGQQLFLDRGGSKWYANIRHEKGYVVWYMPGPTPAAALVELVRALRERGEPEYDVQGEFSGPNVA